MIKSILIDIAYLYYPKGISSIEQREEYLNSTEFKRLANLLNTFIKNEEYLLCYNILLSQLKKNEMLFNIRDVSLIDWQDRSLTFEIDIVNGNKLNKININISLLIPFYIITLLEIDIELEPYKWISLPKRSKILEESMYKDVLNFISSTIESTLKFYKFPEEIADIIIPDLSFNDIRIGDFTLYNAFFLDDNKL